MKQAISWASTCPSAPGPASHAVWLPGGDRNHQMRVWGVRPHHPRAAGEMISRDALQVGPPRIRIIIGSDQQIASRSSHSNTNGSPSAKSSDTMLTLTKPVEEGPPPTRRQPGAAEAARRGVGRRRSEARGGPHPVGFAALTRSFASDSFSGQKPRPWGWVFRAVETDPRLHGR